MRPHVHCHKSWRNISSPSDISELFHEDIKTNISSLLVDTFPEVARIFPSSHFHDVHMMKDFEIYGKMSAHLAINKQEERWLNGSAPDYKSVVLGSNPAPPQHTANSVIP
jgi:hypothetical protein